MKLRLLSTLILAFTIACTLSISASAQDRDDQNRHVDQDRDHNHAEQWQNRNNWDYRTYQGEQRPEGWAEGRRANNRYCEGHNGCYSYNYQGVPHYYYRDENGRMIVRRKHREGDKDDYRKDNADRRDRDDRH